MSTSTRTRFLADHEQLELLLRELIAAFETGDRDVAREVYRKFDVALAEHLAIEEEQLFPELSTTEPGEVTQLRTEHAAIRRRLDELGIGVDLHLTRLPAIRALVDDLHAHALREDRLLYPWADRVLSEHARAQLGSQFVHGRSPAPPVPR